RSPPAARRGPQAPTHRALRDGRRRALVEDRAPGRARPGRSRRGRGARRAPGADAPASLGRGVLAAARARGRVAAAVARPADVLPRSEEHTSELQSLAYL